jgi:hypothetical protein
LVCLLSEGVGEQEFPIPRYEQEAHEFDAFRVNLELPQVTLQVTELFELTG